MNKLFFFLMIAVNLIIQPAIAVEIEETGKDAITMDECSLIVRGEIEKGDAIRIEAALAKWKKRSPNAPHNTAFKGLDYVVCLSGNGGDYMEAIKIAGIFEQSMVATSVPKNATCLAACAIAFLGGRDCCIEMGMSMTKRHLSENSILGIGAPVLVTGKTSFTGQEIENSFNESLDIITELQNKAQTLDISATVINKLIEHRNGNLFEIKPDPAHQHNYLDGDGKVFQDIWVPFVSGTVNQGTLDQ